MQDDSREPPEESADASFADILKEFEAAERRALSGGPRRGTVVGISGDYVLIDYGSKAEGVIPSADLLDRDGKLTVKRGDTFDVAVIGRNNEGMVTLSRVAGRRPQDWDTLTRAFQNKEIIAGRITATVKGVSLWTWERAPSSRPREAALAHPRKWNNWLDRKFVAASSNSISTTKMLWWIAARSWKKKRARCGRAPGKKRRRG